MTKITRAIQAKAMIQAQATLLERRQGKCALLDISYNTDTRFKFEEDMRVQLAALIARVQPQSQEGRLLTNVNTALVCLANYYESLGYPAVTLE